MWQLLSDSDIHIYIFGSKTSLLIQYTSANINTHPQKHALA